MLDRTTVFNHLNTRWTDEKEAILRKMWKEGASCLAVARELGGGFTRSAIAGKVQRLGLDKRRDDAPRAMRRKAAYFATNITKKKKFQAVAPTPAADTVPAEFRGLTFAQLEPWHCRYPRGEKAPYLYCGAPKVRDSYCEHCYAITHWIVTESTANRYFWFEGRRA